MYKTKEFQHNGKPYEVRIASDGKTIHIRAFKDGKPANGYTYSVEILEQVEAKAVGSAIDPAEALIEIAISDVRNEIWEKYVESLNALKGQGA